MERSIGKLFGRNVAVFAESDTFVADGLWTYPSGAQAVHHTIRLIFEHNVIALHVVGSFCNKLGCGARRSR